MKKARAWIIFGVALAIVYFSVSLSWAAEWREGGTVVKGGGPSLIQDKNGMFWLAYDFMQENNEDIYVVYSDDLKNWSEPIRVTWHNKSDFHPSLVQNRDGRFFIVFTSIRSGNYDLYLVWSDSGMEWSEPLRLTEDEDNDWYPFMTFDREGDLLISFSSSRGEGGIYILTSEDGEVWSEARWVIGTRKDIYPMVVWDGDLYWMVFVRHTGDYDVRSRANEHELFLAYSDDLLDWGRVAQLTYTKEGSFSLYPSFIRDVDGNLWVSYTSDELGNEEVYLFGSKNGREWSKAERITSNMEYRRSINSTDSFKCDLKSLIEESGDGDLVIAYECVREGNDIYFVSGRPELDLSEPMKVAFFDVGPMRDMDGSGDDFSGGYKNLILLVFLLFIGISAYFIWFRKRID